MVGFDIYRKATEKPLFQIIKNLKSKFGQKYCLKDQHGKIVKYSSELKYIISLLHKKNLRLIKWLKNSFYLKKSVGLVEENLLGEKNGKRIGSW